MGANDTSGRIASASDYCHECAALAAENARLRADGLLVLTVETVEAKEEM